jgi:hypothetical protein
MGKWNEQLILDGLKQVVEQTGQFPTHRDLTVLKKSGLRNAIISSGKTISHYAELIGHKTKTKPRDFWNKITIKKELKTICNELGYFPTRKQLIEMGHSSLQMAMWQDGTTIQFWQNLLGYETKRVPNGYWDNEDTIIKEMMLFTEQYDFLPTQAALIHNGRNDLSRAIDRSGKGLAYFQKLAGFQPPFYEATDGHFLDSSYELALDEWLYAHGIEHTVHGFISRAHGRYRYDFKIGDTYVEIWGYEPHNKTEFVHEYNAKRKVKEAIYDELKLPRMDLEATLFAGSVEKVNEKIHEMFRKFI